MVGQYSFKLMLPLQNQLLTSRFILRWNIPILNEEKLPVSVIAKTLKFLELKTGVDSINMQSFSPGKSQL